MASPSVISDKGGLDNLEVITTFENFNLWQNESSSRFVDDAISSGKEPLIPEEPCMFLAIRFYRRHSTVRGRSHSRKDRFPLCKRAFGSVFFPRFFSHTKSISRRFNLASVKYRPRRGTSEDAPLPGCNSRHLETSAFSPSLQKTPINSD